MKLTLTVLLLLVGMVLQTLALSHRSNYPNPQKNTDECGRQGRASWVCDPEKALTFEEANQLDVIIQKIGNATRCSCSEHVCKRDSKGFPIGIAISPKIVSDEEMQDYADGLQEYEKAYPPRIRLHHIQLFAYTLMKKWKLGKCDDGILMVFDPVNYSLYTVGGTVALRRLSPNRIGDITATNRDRFGKGAFLGLQKMLADYRAVLLNKYNNPIYSSRPKTAAVVSRNGASAPVTISGLTVLLMSVVAALW